jgi:hypothetical protein
LGKGSKVRYVPADPLACSDCEHAVTVVIGPDNHRLVTGSADKKARLWLFQMGRLD